MIGIILAVLLVVALLLLVAGLPRSRVIFDILVTVAIVWLLVGGRFA